jgi:hypothetical protein
MPQQALALGNSELVVGQAKELVGKLGEGLGEEEFVRGAFLRVLGRRASEEEVGACREFLAGFNGEKGRAREQLVVVLFNHNDFVAVR